MTIPSTLKAYIVADGQRQKEYPDEDAALDDESPNLASTYIECKSGSTFVVQFEIRPSRSNPFVFKSDAIDVQVFLDGRRTKGQLINRSIIPSHGGYCCKIPGVFKNIGERWEFRPFVFREIRHGKLIPNSV